MINQNRNHDDGYRLLFENMLDGFAYCEMIIKEGESVDFIYLDVNKAFYTLTGLENVVGKPVSEVIPGLKKDNPELFEIYGRVATTAKSERFESYIDALRLWLNISVYCPEKGFFVAVFDNITDRKQAEESLRHKSALLEAQLNATIDGILIVDSEGKKTIQNKRTAELWKIPQHIADNPDDSAQVAHVMHLTKNPKQFVDKVTYLYEHPCETTQDLVELTDGTILERYSAPIVGNDEKNYGRIWIFHDITTRKNTEQYLFLEHERLSLATRAGQMGIWDWDIVSNMLVWDDNMYGLYGVDKKDFAGAYEAWLSGLHPDDIERCNRESEMARNGQKNYDTEFRIIRPDGSIRHLKALGTVLRDDGKPTRMIGLNYDITERKETELRYQLFRDRLNFAIEAARMGAWELDLVDHTAWRSYRHDEIFGYGSLLSNWTFEMFIDHVIAEDRDQVKEKFLNALKEKTDWDFECRIKRVDGTISWIWAKGSPKYDTNNTPSKMFGIVQDISERKNAEDALRQQQARTSDILAGIADTFYSVDTDWRFTVVNPAAEKAPFGRPAAEILGKVIWDLYPGLVGTFIQKNYFEALEKKTLKHYEGQSPLNGRWYEVFMQGWTGGVDVHMRDITEKKQSERIIQNSQKLESLGVLAGGIAHDFNNLLGGIYGYIDMAGEKTKDDKLSLYLSKAMNTIDRARALTQQLVTFAKGGAPIMKIGPLFPFVQETAQFALSGSSILCRFDVAQGLWACNFDKNQIGQVIDNIIINAQQAMPMGGTIDVVARNTTVTEKEHPLLAKGNYITISIHDTGIGIPKEFLVRIFDPFFTTKPKGHGLGLATCYSIINRHGGCIDVDSQPGNGSAFHIHLPASMEGVAPDTKKSTKKYQGTGAFLVMDDEEVMRETIGDMLSSLGFTVVCKENGQDAVDFFIREIEEKRTFAGMVFDLTVPGGMGGQTALEMIRKLNTEIPVFVASGYAEDPVMKNPAEFGFTASICKPFRKSELTEMLGKYIKKTDS